MKKEIFVIEDKFYKALYEFVSKNDHYITSYQFSWKGKKIYAKKALLNYCIYTAEDETKNLQEYRDKIIKRSVEIAKQFKWVKDKKKYSRCGKWIKGIMEKSK